MSVERFYDELAPFYHLIFPDWEASIQRQAESLDGVIRERWGEGRLSILDVACGIGTQALGLAALGHRVTASDISAAEAVIPIMGPRSRDLLSCVSPDDFSNVAHPFGTAREIEIGLGLARAHRVTYVGELGWELYVSSDQAAHVFETLMEAGEDLGLSLCGLHAMDSCRIEKAYRHFVP